MVSEMTGVTTCEIPAARAPRSCLKRARTEEDSSDASMVTIVESDAPPARRARLAYTVSVGFVRDVYTDEAQDPEHAPRAVGEGTATRRSGWVDDHQEVEAMAVHDGPLAESLIISMLVQAISTSQDPSATIPILSLLCQHRSSQLFIKIQERILTLKARIEARGSASLLPSNVTIGTQSVALLNFISESVASASLLIPCTDLPAVSIVTPPPQVPVSSDDDMAAATCTLQLVQDNVLVGAVCPQMPC
jgi:hypothetical protein